MALTEAQLRARSSGLGGTDMVAICGETNFRSAIDVYLEKRHGIGLPIPVAPPKPFEGNERTEWGHILEPILAARFAADTGTTLIEPKNEAGENITFRHPDRSWHLGTPDRLVYDGNDCEFETMTVLDALTGDAVGWLKQPGLIWEGKSHGMMAAKDKYDLENMTVPDDKKIQTHWYGALTGCRTIVLSALIDTHIYRVFHIPHDQAVEDYLLEEAELFWRKIQEGIEPLPDGTKGFGEYLKGRFRLHQEDMIEMPLEVAPMLSEYKMARADKKVAEGRMELAKQEIQLAIGHHQGLVAPSGKTAATWKRRAVGSTSYGKLATHLRDLHGMLDTEFDEAKAEFTGEPQRDFRVK